MVTFSQEDVLPDATGGLCVSKLAQIDYADSGPE
jgi:hypothetical protein